MHDFRCVNAEDMHYSNLSKGVDYFKNSEEGVQIMCREMEQMREEARKEGLEEANRNTALRLFDLGDSIEKISAGVEESEETVTNWLREAGKVQ